MEKEELTAHDGGTDRTRILHDLPKQHPQYDTGGGHGTMPYSPAEHNG